MAVVPTILEVCDIAQPDNLDGRSLVPLLGGSKGWDEDRKLIVQCPRSRVRKKWKNTSVKYQNWRLVDGDQLFNVESDFGQNNDVARKNPKVVKALTDAYESFWSSLPPADASPRRIPLTSFARGRRRWPHGLPKRLNRVAPR